MTIQGKNIEVQEKPSTFFSQLFFGGLIWKVEPYCIFKGIEKMFKEIIVSHCCLPSLSPNYLLEVENEIVRYNIP